MRIARTLDALRSRKHKWPKAHRKAWGDGWQTVDLPKAEGRRRAKHWSGHFFYDRIRMIKYKSEVYVQTQKENWKLHSNFFFTI